MSCIRIALALGALTVVAACGASDDDPAATAPSDDPQISTVEAAADEPGTGNDLGVTEAEIELGSEDLFGELPIEVEEGAPIVVRALVPDVFDAEVGGELSFGMAADGETYAALLEINGGERYMLDEQVTHHLGPVGLTGGGLDFGALCYVIDSPVDGTYAATATRERGGGAGTIFLTIERVDSTSGLADDGCQILD